MSYCMFHNASVESILQYILSDILYPFSTRNEMWQLSPQMLMGIGMAQATPIRRTKSPLDTTTKGMMIMDPSWT